MIAKMVPLSLRLTCSHPPPGLIEGKPVVFGLQGRKDELLTGQPGVDDALVYLCEGQATLFNDERVHRELRSPYIHGKRDEPFLYFSLRFADSSSDLWLRRWKILFTRLSDDLILEAGGRPIEAVVDLKHGNSPPRVTFVEDWRLARLTRP